MPFNGHSIVILNNNCSIHHVSGVACMSLLYCPIHLIYLNPIEECFSMVKSLLKNMEMTLHIDVESRILAAFSCATPNDCKGRISYSTIIIQY